MFLYILYSNFSNVNLFKSNIVIKTRKRTLTAPTSHLVAFSVFQNPQLWIAMDCRVLQAPLIGNNLFILSLFFTTLIFF